VTPNDPYRSPGPGEVDAPEDQEPNVSGTLFFMTLLLLLIFGFWVMMYATLLDR
jgi:hypothetical protein